MFEDNEEMLEFMDDFGFGEQQIKVLDDLKRYEAAGELCLTEGRTMDAIGYFLRSDSTRRRGIESIIFGLWQHLHLGQKVAQSDSMNQFVTMAKRALTENLDDLTRLKVWLVQSQEL